MPTPRHLTKAPIVEAIIDIQGSTKTSVTALERLGGVIGYRVEGDKVATADIVLNTSKSEATQSVILHGYKFTSTDGKYICQFRTNGMTLSRLEPYENWDIFYREAIRTWNAYQAVASVEAVSRIAVRNINRLEFPLAEFAQTPKKFLNTFAELPGELTSANRVGAWIFRYHLQDKGSKMWAFFTQASKTKNEELQAGVFSMILDVDAYLAGPLPTNIEEFGPLLDQLHHYKNSIFFAAITDETLKRYI